MSRSKPSKQTSLQQDRTEIEPLLSTSNAAVVPPALEEPAIVSASVESPDYKLPHDLSPSTSPLHALPIAFRPSNRQPHRWTFPILFVSGMIAIISVQAVYCLLFYPPRVVGTLVRWKAAVRWADKGLDGGREWTKVLFGQLLILITVLYAPTSLTLSTDGSLDLDAIIHPRRARDGSPETRPSSPSSGQATVVDGIDLPENLVVMANHQAYLDWMYVWMLGVLSTSSSGGAAGETEGDGAWKHSAAAASSEPRRRHHGSQSLIILLKRSLKWVPIVGWGMQFFNFIFMNRSWASDRPNMTLALSQLAARCKRPRSSGGGGIWLLIFPEGTITSDEERVKSVRYAKREGVSDFVNCLHPRATGLLFCLRTLRRAGVKDLRVLDLTIAYPGVPRGGYAQEWYNLGSVFWRGVSPPTVHVHMRLIDPRTDDVPGVSNVEASQAVAPLGDASPVAPARAGVADQYREPSTEETTAFNLWLRGRWQDKEDLLNTFAEHGRFVEAKHGDQAGELVSELSTREIALGF